MKSLRLNTICWIAILWMGAAAGLFGEVSSRPAVLQRPFYDVQAGSIDSIETVSGLDVVFFLGGATSGFRPGMICQVSGSVGLLGELLVVDVAPERSAALILNLSTNRPLQPGQQVRIKIRPASNFTR